MLDTNETTQLAPLKKGEKVGQTLSLYNGRVMPQTFGQVIDFAQMMAKGGIAIGKHLRDNPGTCLRVIQQSMAWEMDPWAVASKTYAVNDILAYEAQLLAAVIKKWAPIRERIMPYKFTGEGGELQCSITVHHAETGEVIFYESPNKKDIKPQNSPLWASDPQQQLGYYSIRALACRHFPDIIMGSYDRDEVMAMKDITPKEGVKNFLEDEDGQVVKLSPITDNNGPVTVDGVHLTKDMKPLDPKTVKVGDEVLFDEQTGEIYPDTTEPVKEPPLVIPPEVIARNLISSLRGETDTVRLEIWQNDNQGEINALPPALLKDVRKALADKFLDLAEL